MVKQAEYQLKLAEVIRAINSRSDFEDIAKSNLYLQDMEALNIAAINLKNDKDIVARFCNWFYLYYKSDKDKNGTFITSQSIFRVLLSFDRGDILEGLMSLGYAISNNNGNLIRQAVYSGKLSIAKALFNAGYPVPETLNLFQISNQLNWKRDRIKLFLDMKTTIILSEEEIGAMHLVLFNSEAIKEDK